MIEEVVAKGFTWNSECFHEMGWSDCRLYGLSFPGQSHIFALDIDYILAGLADCDVGAYHLVAAKVFFDNVVNLKVSLDLGHNEAIYLVGISRYDPRPTPNGQLIYYDFNIETDAGSIILTATSLRQIAANNSVQSNARDLAREAVYI